MSFNFPNSPTPGQLYTPVGGYQYVYPRRRLAGGRGTAVCRHGAEPEPDRQSGMQISQENCLWRAALPGIIRQINGRAVSLRVPFLASNECNR